MFILDFWEIANVANLLESKMHRISFQKLPTSAEDSQEFAFFIAKVLSFAIVRLRLQ